jgi:hypothetical protein
MAVVDFSTNKVQAWAVIDGLEIELYRYEDDWGLNTIPTANLYCAVGRDCTSLEAAAIHDLINDFKVNLPVTVYGQASELANSGETGGEWPEGQFILFQGLVVASNFSKSKSGSATIVLRCRHFLAQLEYALTNLRTSHPKAVGNFNMPAGLGQAADNFTGNTAASQFFNFGNITDDMWDLSFAPWLLSVINTEAVFEGDNIEEGQGSTDAAKVITQFFEPFDGGYKYGVALQIDPSFNVLGLPSAIQAITNDISKTMLESFYGTTIWEKLVQEYASNYLFAIVPMTDRALVIPFVPGLRTTFITIDPSEYDTISDNNTMPRALYGVVIYTGMNSMAGAFGFQEGAAADQVTVGGEFFNSGLDAGMIVFRDGPNWLANPVNGQGWGLAAAPQGMIKGNQFNPGAGNAPKAGQPGVVRGMAISLWDAYARGVYLYETLKNRKMTIKGKLRFDIAPGSSVEVVTDEEQFVAEQTGIDNLSYFGMVTRITNVIDAEGIEAGTTIELGYVHNEIEHTSDATSTDNHPLYSSVFTGAPLVSDFPSQPEPIPFPAPAGV